ncbi:hypothetical protein SALGADO_71 [Arthrobacter phage Salgado]|uniref:Uncharacterized protein n=2 Tax=Laroyevirus TaxID=1982086 RepID=A0A0U4B687_9CAUD|nr:hypothetical protein KMD21_gp68 [Arthrobacter phage LiSara]YP_010082680.1 hypothetical protein KMD22_gp71 [Arthrobacter phage Salgado]ALY10237.1 hypothetical protein SALGADO_71 [Arthrobacter phage Salgado]ASR83652.1 hypothetical protein SEA_LISARA_68 [Arthrobacter phage LiSara]
MAGVLSPEGVILPAGADTYDYLGEQRRMAASQRTIVPVADRTAAESVSAAMAADGRPVSDTNPLIVYNIATQSVEVKDAGGWNGSLATPAFAHAGKTDGFQTTIGTDVAVVLNSAQVLKGGFTFETASGGRLVVPYSGWYKINAQFYITGGSGYRAQCKVYKNSSPAGIGANGLVWKADGTDFTTHVTSTVQLTAGDKLGLGTTQTAGSAWGTDGYNGSYLEVQYLGV